MRILFAFLLLLGPRIAGVHAQPSIDVGSPDAAFSGGPIHLSKQAAALLRAHYQGDKVPIVPQPFRGRLDTALAGHDWPRIETVKKDLATSQGIVAVLTWEQSRFIATGSIGVAEMHALDLASTGSSAVSETAVMMWFYAVAVTMTDGHKCSDEAAKDAHLDRLRGPPFEPVTRLVRTISDDRLAAMRDLAIRLETVLSQVRDDDTMCRVGNRPADVKAGAIWRPEAAMTRTMLPRHLVALASVMRPRQIGRPEPPKPEIATQAVPNPVTVEPALPASILSLPLLPEPASDKPPGPDPVKAEPPKPESTAPERPAGQ